MRAGLNRERILRAALELVDRDGIEGLTMRALGAALGVKAMSLYRYVASKDELLDELQEAVLADMPPVPDGLPWRDAVGANARALRAALARHPRAIVLFARPAVTDAVVGITERSVRLFEEGGFEPADAVRAYQTIIAYVVGQALWQFTPTEPREVDDEFEFGLETLLDGLEVRAAQR